MVVVRVFGSVFYRFRLFRHCSLWYTFLFELELLPILRVRLSMILESC
jgi:hypothetical protein